MQCKSQLLHSVEVVLVVCVSCCLMLCVHWRWCLSGPAVSCVAGNASNIKTQARTNTDAQRAR
eukprot:1891-Heterococcus_DN1.PRE.1